MDLTDDHVGQLDHNTRDDKHPLVVELGIEIDAGISDVLWSLEDATPDELGRAVATWMNTAAGFCRDAAYWREDRAEPAEERIKRALNELGVPGPGYPAPVANAVEILSGRVADE